jgi:hypothetical protein
VKRTDVATYAAIAVVGCACAGFALYAEVHLPPVVFDLQPGAHYHSPWAGQTPFYGAHEIDPSRYGLNPQPDLIQLGLGGRHARGMWLQVGRDAVFRVCAGGLVTTGPCRDVAVVRDRFLEPTTPPT